ncbi:MAG: SDR family NAD(P)-dependent oxidoreductase [Anaerolineaceae bacterium]|nr:SDR family NAD(P)-dependent oxidoreductase [Anaerolineaceae bacterium]
MIAINLNNKIAVVTGAGGNLGQAVSKTLFDAGAKVVLTGHSLDSLHVKFPEYVENPNVLFEAPLDMTSMKSVSRLAENVIERFGKVDIIINTVGGFYYGPPIHEMELECLDKMFELNTKTIAISAQAFAPFLIKNKSGKIINISAKPALKGTSNIAAYAASKSAVLNLTESMADELKGFNIQVNCLLPSIIDTPQNRKNMPKANFNNWVKPEEIANVIAFLVSDLSNAITGAGIPVYGKT